MTPPAVDERAESPIHTAVRLHEFLSQAAHQIQGHIDKLDTALTRQ